jgi:leucyl aminopeptidase
VQSLPRPGRGLQRVLLAGIGDGGESGWRAAAAEVVRAARREPALAFLAPADPAELRAVAEAAWLAAYRFRLGAGDPDSAARLRRLTVVVPGAPAADVEAALAQARILAEATMLARDLTNTPSLDKSPKWFADTMVRAAQRRTGVEATVLEPAELAEAGFGGILAVGGGSARGPRLLQLRWRPRGAKHHVVLIGKGVTFDTGGISIKPIDGMRLMRKDMGGAAAAGAALLAAADLKLGVRVTAVLPLAENMVSGSAARPGDVVRHYGGMTSEVQNTDAEGRVILADALAYAVKRLRPDVMVDLATLTGASRVALGSRIAALFSHDDTLAAGLAEAGAAVHEPMWRMPLHDEYTASLHSDVADLTNAPIGGAGAITAALYLREFTGDLRQRWAHIDMSGPSWVESDDAELSKGATGWGVRTLVRWLSAVAAGAAPHGGA